MGHSRRRPITGQTAAGVGIKYIVVEAFQDDTNIQVIANGTVTFTVDTTIQNIMYDATALAAVNLSQPEDSDRYVAPTAAVWDNVIASGSVSATVALANLPIFAVRINITAGTGSVSYHIAQG
jgi:hypothetical protein